MAEQSRLRLILIRHGEAERTAPRDELRRLTQHGCAEADAVAQLLDSLQIAPSGIHASPYVRAQETAKRISAHLSGEGVTTLQGVTPDDDPRRAMRAIEPLLQLGLTPLVVTHMPLIGALIGSLVDGDARDAPGVATGAGVVLVGEVFVPGLMRVERWLRP